MTKNEVIPGFDCVASKRKAQSQIYEEIRGLSHEEEIRYFEQQALRGPLGELWRRLTKRPKNGSDARGRRPGTSPRGRSTPSD